MIVKSRQESWASQIEGSVAKTPFLSVKFVACMHACGDEVFIRSDKVCFPLVLRSSSLLSTLFSCAFHNCFMDLQIYLWMVDLSWLMVRGSCWLMAHGLLSSKERELGGPGPGFFCWQFAMSLEPCHMPGLMKHEPGIIKKQAWSVAHQSSERQGSVPAAV